MASAAQLAALRQETFWANRSEVNDAERDYYAAKSGAKVRRSSVERYATFRYVTWGSADVRNLLPSV